MYKFMDALYNASMNKLIRKLILLVPQHWVPVWIENKFFTFDEVAGRAYAETTGGFKWFFHR